MRGNSRNVREEGDDDGAEAQREMTMMFILVFSIFCRLWSDRISLIFLPPPSFWLREPIGEGFIVQNHTRPHIVISVIKDYYRMKEVLEEIQNLIDEAKIRFLWWILCIYGVSYLFTHTSNSMVMNVPIALLLVCGLRMLFNEVEFRWKATNVRPTTYLSVLEKKQLSVNDSRLSTRPYPQKWKRKIDSPVVEAALEDLVNKMLQEFITDLWYSEITPDRDGPDLIQDLIMDVLGEVSCRIKEVNLINLLTRDAVELIGDHIEQFRKHQSAIGKDVMGTLSSEERDERLKRHLLASKELHPALISPECEYKVIQQLSSGLLAIVLRPREAQCPLIRCFGREILTCLILKPIMSIANPQYINEMIEYIINLYKTELAKMFASKKCPPNKDPPNKENHNSDNPVSGEHGSDDQVADNASSSKIEENKELDSGGTGNVSSTTVQEEPVTPRPAEWAKVYEAATMRREEVLMPENLENMWTIGVNYKQKLHKKAAPEHPHSEVSSPTALHRKELVTEGPPKLVSEIPTNREDKVSEKVPQLQEDSEPTNIRHDTISRSQDPKKTSADKGATIHEIGNAAKVYKKPSIPDSEINSNKEHTFTSKGGSSANTENCSADVNKLHAHRLKSNPDTLLCSEDVRVPKLRCKVHVPKLRCQVVGADFLKLGSSSFAVYTIAVSDVDKNTWIVKRRYRNFDRLHKKLKEIRNYTLQLPPKKMFTSSTEDSLVRERCVQLDKYLQELLLIGNVSEHIEVWDFLSPTSEKYSVEKSSSVIKTLTANADGVLNDTVWPSNGVSDGLKQRMVSSPTSQEPYVQTPIVKNNSFSSIDDIVKLTTRQSTSDSDDSDKDLSHEHHEAESSTLAYSDAELKEGPAGVPPEWTPPNLSVPMLNLVDKLFQLKRRGWIRRQVFWISKQILHLVMEDAIDDWLVRQIQWIRRDDVVAKGIRYLKAVLWPDGKNFFLTMGLHSRLKGTEGNQGSQTARSKGAGTGSQPRSFEQQLEAVRRASDIKKLLVDGAPTALVGMIGKKQYKRCARDLYYFLQSTICLKQIAYGMLELGLTTLFPELHDVVMKIHERMLAKNSKSRH